MKKSFFTLIVLAILSTPFVVLGIISIMQVKPEARKSINDLPSEMSVTPSAIPSKTFMSGYWDGWHGIWLGPIHWTISDDYRQGHMLGSYDKKNGINRYPRP